MITPTIVPVIDPIALYVPGSPMQSVICPVSESIGQVGWKYEPQMKPTIAPINKNIKT